MLTHLRKVAILAALVSAPVAGCAYAHEGPEAYSQEILSELPANAPPGECYAKVVVPGEPVPQPPVMQGAVWVVSPGQPGMPGPIWCLVPTGPVAQAPMTSPARYGWIRVLCDSDATPERIEHIQRALHDRGYYRGEVSGHYDRDTVEAVSRFQAGAHINHGGYLSLETVQALDAGPGDYEQPPQVAASYGYAGAYADQAQAAPCGCAPGYAPPPPVYYQQSYAPFPPPQSPQAYPCCATAQSYGYSTGYGGGYGFGAPPPAYAAAAAYAGGGYASAHASARAVVQNGWLVWNGKSGF